MAKKQKKTVKQRLAANIARFRADRELTQAELAAALGVGTLAVSQWECGRRSPEYDRLDDIAMALECEAWELLR